MVSVYVRQIDSDNRRNGLHQRRYYICYSFVAWVWRLWTNKGTNDRELHGRRITEILGQVLVFETFERTLYDCRLFWSTWTQGRQQFVYWKSRQRPYSPYVRSFQTHRTTWYTARTTGLRRSSVVRRVHTLVLGSISKSNSLFRVPRYTGSTKQDMLKNREENNAKFTVYWFSDNETL